MKKMLAAVLALVLLLGFMQSCESNQVIRFQLKVVNELPQGYFICAEGQEIKQELQLEDFKYTEEPSGNVTLRTYDVVVKYPGEVMLREDGRSFWTLYYGHISENGEFFSFTMKNVGIRSGRTTVEAFTGGKVLYDTVKTVYSDENFALYADDGMDDEGRDIFYDTQFVWYEKDGERESCGEILPGATIKLLGQNTPKSNGEVETWFSVISGIEGIGEIDRFSVMTKAHEPQPECTLTYADLPDVVSEEGAKWLAASEFAADGIKPETDLAAMKAAFGEPMSSWGEYDRDLNYMVYQYDGVRYTFLTGILDDHEWEETNWAYNAKFTKNLVEFPRDIQIGDSFEEVLKKFPQEMDYKNDMNESLFYGDYWAKRNLGWGSVRIRNDDFNNDNGVSISVICDEYWPMIQVHFTDELIADKITVQFSPYPFG